MNNIDILGIQIDNLSMDACIVTISNRVTDGTPLWIVTANPELIYRAQHDHELRSAISQADLIIPDGIGVVWAARQLGATLKGRITGIDLVQQILKEGNEQGWRIFLLGSKPGVAEKAVREQNKKYPNIHFDAHHGYFSKKEEPAILAQIKSFAPDILLVGLGAPKQEYWNYFNKDLSKIRVGVGGTIDVLSGEVRRAPRFFQQHNMEWLYRLVKEPSRIRRQLVLPMFVKEVMKTKYLRP